MDKLNSLHDYLVPMEMVRIIQYVSHYDASGDVHKDVASDAAYVTSSDVIGPEEN